MSAKTLRSEVCKKCGGTVWFTICNKGEKDEKIIGWCEKCEQYYGSNQEEVL